MTRIVSANDLNPNMLANLAKQQADVDGVVRQLFCAAFSGCVAADMTRAVSQELLRRQKEAVDPSTPVAINFQPEFAAQAALQYAKAGYAALVNGPKKQAGQAS